MDPREFDALVRTVHGEAGGEGPQGQAAVAAVILNRSRMSGQPVTSVVSAPGQFEAWRTPRVQNLNPNSPAYQRIAANITPLVSGDMPDPTNGADHFIAPNLQRQMGRRMPAWAQGQGTDIGNQRFFRVGYNQPAGAAPRAQSSDDIFGFAPAQGAPQTGGGAAQSSDDIFGFAPAQGQPSARQPASQPRPRISPRRTMSPTDAMAAITAQMQGVTAQAQNGTHNYPAMSGGSVGVGARGSARPTSADIAQQRFGQMRPNGITGMPMAPRAGWGDPNGPVQTRGFTDQMVSNLGLGDETSGAAAYVMQGAENLGRRMMGQPIQVSGRDAYHAGAQRDRREQASYAREHPFLNAQANTAGFLTAGAPNAMAAVAPAATTLGRAVQTGGNAALASFPYTFANEQGDAAQRLPGAARNSLLAGAVGGSLQYASEGLGALARGAANRRPSPQRELAQRGVNLTPGQIFGGPVQTLEDASTSQPLLGGAIRNAQRGSITSFNRASHNETLAPIGQTLPRNVRMGRDAMDYTRGAISNTYNRALDPITVAPDAQFVNDLRAAVGGVRNDEMRTQMQNLLDGQLSGQVNGPMSGQQWKRIDEQLGAITRQAQAGSARNPVMGQLQGGLGQAREAWRGILQRQHPDAAQTVAAADTAHANYLRLVQASQKVATARRGGEFTAPELNSAVQAMDNTVGNRAFAHGDALMQNLTEPAMQVLPPTMPDSGTAGRLNRGLTIPDVIHAGLMTLPAATYTVAAPVINRLYQNYARGNAGQTAAALRQLTSLAARHPALVPLARQAAGSVGLSAPRLPAQQRQAAPTAP